MKKQVLFSFFMLSSMTVFAQTTLWDGESYDLGSRGGCWDDGAPTVVANPDASGINTSDKCLAFTMTNSQKVVKVPFRDWIKPDLKGNRRISMMIKRSGNGNVNVEISDPTDGSAGYWEKVAAWYGGNGDWQKIVLDYSTNTAMNDFPGVMSITASTDNVEGEETVYIDNIVVEPVPMVNGTALNEIADGSLTGELTLTGSWMKGDCQNTNGEWIRVNYDDFEKLAAKLSADVTSMNMRGTVLKDAYNAFGNVNPNILIYADRAFGEFNVIVNGHTNQLNLNENYVFKAPEDFFADHVSMTRAMAEGHNTVCLPFSVTAAELGATNIATYASSATTDGTTTVSFNIAGSVAANTPLITDGATASDAQQFTDKTIEATSAIADGKFIGVYAPQSAENHWGIANNEFRLGGPGATIKAFHAYLTQTNEAKSMVFSIGDATGIANLSNVTDMLVDVYTITGKLMKKQVHAANAADGLIKGVYIINNKKFIIYR